MKKIIMGMALWSGLSLGYNALAQKAQPSNQFLAFGQKITPDGAITTNELVSNMAGKEEMITKVQGEVISVCQARGCWAKVKLPDGQTMRVTFKDYAFFVPKDASGKTMVMEGKAFVKTVPVEELRHYAKDAGASQAEVAKITKPERSLAFEADGVLIK